MNLVLRNDEVLKKILIQHLGNICHSKSFKSTELNKQPKFIYFCVRLNIKGTMLIIAGIKIANKAALLLMKLAEGNAIILCTQNSVPET